MTSIDTGACVLRTQGLRKDYGRDASLVRAVCSPHCDCHEPRFELGAKRHAPKRVVHAERPLAHRTPTYMAPKYRSLSLRSLRRRDSEKQAKTNDRKRENIPNAEQARLIKWKVLPQAMAVYDELLEQYPSIDERDEHRSFNNKRLISER